MLMKWVSSKLWWDKMSGVNEEKKNVISVGQLQGMQIGMPLVILSWSAEG